MSLHRPALTPLQAAFIQTLLPPLYSLQLAPTLIPKRDCPRKLDNSFLTDFVDPPSPKQLKGKFSQPISVEKTVREASGRKEGRVGKEMKQVAIEERKEIRVKEQKFPFQTSTEAVLDAPIYPNKKEEDEKDKELLPSRQADLAKILQRLRQHKSSWPFRLPVDPIKQEVPNYLQIVKQPMDLKTMQKKLKNGSYTRDELFDHDVRKIISNSFLFNPKTSVYHAHTIDFENYYAQLLTTLAPNGMHKNSEKEGKKGREIRITAKEREKILKQIEGLGQAQLAKLVKRLYKDELKSDWQEVEIDLAKLTEAQMRELTSLLPP